MDCSKASDYFMKYMDSVLSEQEAEGLNTHLQQCEKCKEDFAIYDEIMKDFAQMEIISAPDNFVEEVMTKINALPVNLPKTDTGIDSILMWVWGVFSVLMGGGFILTVNSEQILAYLSTNPRFDGYLNTVYNISAQVSEITSQIYSATDTLSSSAAAYLDSSRYVLLVVFSILAGAQYFIYRKDKVGA